MAHEPPGRLAARPLDALHEIGRRAARLQHFSHDSDCALADCKRLMMKAQDDGVARFDGDQGLEHGGRDRIGDGGDREHDADRTRQLGHLSIGVEGQRALGDLAGQRRVDPETGKTVLPGLVCRVPHSGFFDGGDGQFFGASGQSLRDVEQEAVDPFVGPVLERLLGRGGAGDNRIDFLIEARIVRKRLQEMARRGAQCKRVGAVQSANVSRLRSNEMPELAPYDQPRFARTSCVSREVNVPPKTVFATAKAV